MAYTKKITINEYVNDIIDYELKPYGIDFNYILNLPTKPLDGTADEKIEYQNDWYTRYVFKNYDEYYNWKKYCYEHIKDYLPKRQWKKKIVDETIAYLDLEYGLKVEGIADTDEFCKMKYKYPDLFDVVFKNNE